MYMIFFCNTQFIYFYIRQIFNTFLYSPVGVSALKSEPRGDLSRGQAEHWLGRSKASSDRGGQRSEESGRRKFLPKYLVSSGVRTV